jgi:hypothetical protein
MMRIMFLKLELNRKSMGLVNCEALGAQALTVGWMSLNDKGIHLFSLIKGRRTFLIVDL